MKYRSIPVTLIASALLVSGAAIAADEAKPAIGQPAAAAQSASPAAAPSASPATKPAEAAKPAAADAKKASTDSKKAATKSTQTKPAASAPTKAAASESDPSKAKAKAKKPKPIDINNASAEELKKIPGVGDAEAERIIKNRPYPTRSSLVERGVFPLEQYYSIKDYMVAVQPDPKASKTSKATKK
jgi:DNA uptake protein ComE-like DNA-binding protein